VRTTIAASVAVLTLGFAAASTAQVIVPGYPYPAYRYAARDAAVRFDVKPKETMVYIDGYYAGIVDDFDGAFQRLRTAPGGHELTLYLDGFRTYSERVYLSPDNTFKIRHRMEKLAGGEVAQRPPAPQPPQYQPGDAGPVTGGPGGQFPPGAGGRRGPRGFPPSPPDNAGGPDGRGGQGPGAPPPPDTRRGSADANNRGTLSLTLQPGDAEVLVDGSPWRGSASGERLTIDLSEGRHNIQIRKPGYVGYLTDVQIRRGETTNLDVNLKSQP
jgi:hypothetical protein